MKIKVAYIIGARPNFMKIYPLMLEMDKYPQKFKQVLIHTSQHYNNNMSRIFFEELRLPRPNFYLGVGSGTHAEQTARIMIRLEKVFLKVRPDLVVVVGDVNSTLAGALVAAKMNIRIAHVESGLRSFDRAMPEEINRILTDSLADYLFVTEKSGLVNLKNEGVASKNIYLVGDIMIDTLLLNLNKIKASKIRDKISIEEKKYCVFTLHRPSNVDSLSSLIQVYHILKAIALKIGIVYPIHPRTKKMLKAFGLWGKFKAIRGLILICPLGYISFMKLVYDCRFVLTDSGGIQEETTFLKIPCLTMRENTERPITLESGTNYLVGRNKSVILNLLGNILRGRLKRSRIPKLWDGKSAARIVTVLRGIK